MIFGRGHLEESLRGDSKTTDEDSQQAAGNEMYREVLPMLVFKA